MKFETLRAKIEEIMQDMLTIASEREELEKKALWNEETERNLRIFEKELKRKQEIIDKENIQIEKEREANTLQASINAKNLEKIENNKMSAKSAVSALHEAEIALDKIEKEMEKLEKRRKEVGDIEKLKEDLEKREALLNKEKALIRESNRILDIRRAKIQAREHQLQMDAEIE